MVIDKIVESHSTVCKVTLSKQSTNILKNETLIPTNKRNPNTLTILEQVEETMKKKKQEIDTANAVFASIGKKRKRLEDLQFLKSKLPPIKRSCSDHPDLRYLMYRFDNKSVK